MSVNPETARRQIELSRIYIYDLRGLSPRQLISQTERSGVQVSDIAKRLAMKLKPSPRGTIHAAEYMLSELPVFDGINPDNDELIAGLSQIKGINLGECPWEIPFLVAQRLADEKNHPRYSRTVVAMKPVKFDQYERAKILGLEQDGDVIDIYAEPADGDRFYPNDYFFFSVLPK